MQASGGGSHPAQPASGMRTGCSKQVSLGTLLMLRAPAAADEEDYFSKEDDDDDDHVAGGSGAVIRMGNGVAGGAHSPLAGKKRRPDTWLAPSRQQVRDPRGTASSASCIGPCMDPPHD